MGKGKINWDKRQIVGRSGKVYIISPETLSAKRAAEYEIRAMSLPFRATFETVFKYVHRVVNDFRNLELATLKAGVIFDTIAEGEMLLKGMREYQISHRSPIVEFCALFCNTKEEDVGEWNEDIIRAKYEDWADIPEDDFFLLSTKAIPFFRSSLQVIIKGEIQTKLNQTTE